MQTGTETTTQTSTVAAPAAAQEAPNGTRLAATAPGQLRVIKRNGTVVPFEDSKISVAITKAFLAVEGGTAAASSRIHETVAKLTEQVIATFERRMPSGGTIHIEDIQDQVELALMRAGEHKIARDYVIYREGRAQERKAKESLSPEAQAAASGINVVDGNGNRKPLDIERIRTIVAEACADLEDVSEAAIIDEALQNLYDGCARRTEHLSGHHRAHSDRAGAQLLLRRRSPAVRQPAREALNFLGVATAPPSTTWTTLYAQSTARLHQRGYRAGTAAPEPLDFDLDGWAKLCCPSATCSLPILACRPCTTATLSTATNVASNCRRFSSCASPWAWP